MSKTIIFDLDGTLCETIYDIADSMNLAIKEYGYKENSVADYKTFIGNGVKELIMRSLHEDTLNPKFEEILNLYIKNYEKLRTNKTKPFPKMVETLIELKNRGYTLAIISNKLQEDSDAIVNKLFPKYLFSYIAGEQKGVNKKPDTMPLDVMLYKLKIGKEDVTYIGDSYVDALFSINCKIPYFIFTYGYGDNRIYDYKPVAFLDKAEQLLDYFT